jgi:hypothetical protein
MPVVTVLAMVAAACGTSPDASNTTNTTANEVTSTSATPTTVAETTSTQVSTTSTSLAGEAVDLGPPSGATLGVIGVAHDDVLNLRAAPGADQPIIGQIPPTDDAVIARGETRSLPAFWTRVTHGGVDGWVNLSYLAYIGATSDTTAEVVAHFGERPEAARMTELGIIVAEAMASADPPSEIVIVVEESVGDLGEVTLDVVGLGDDAVRGVRLHVFGSHLDDLFQLRTVEQTVLCDPTRGVDDDGVCV